MPRVSFQFRTKISHKPIHLRQVCALHWRRPPRFLRLCRCTSLDADYYLQPHQLGIFNLTSRRRLRPNNKTT